MNEQAFALRHLANELGVEVKRHREESRKGDPTAHQTAEILKSLADALNRAATAIERLTT